MNMFLFHRFFLTLFPVVACLTLVHIYRPLPRRSPAAVVVAILLLIGGVEVNPGPEDITSKQFGFTTEQIKVNPVLLPDFKYDTIRYDSVCLTCSKKLTGSQLSLPHEVHSRETEGSFPQQATTSISP